MKSCGTLICCTNSRYALCMGGGGKIKEVGRFCQGFFSCYITASFMLSRHWLIQLTSWLKPSTHMHSEGRLSPRLCPSEPLQQSGRRSVALGSSCMMGNRPPSAAEFTFQWQRSSLDNCCANDSCSHNNCFDAVLSSGLRGIFYFLSCGCFCLVFFFEWRANKWPLMS